MRLFVGLGNPGADYARNRHNIGFMAADAIADEYGFPSFKKKFSGELSEGKIGGEKVALLKPMTYMNLSGQCVGAVATFYKIKPKNIIVFYDEIEIGPTRVKVKRGGGHAGHNGLRSLDEHLPANDYMRVRMGVGRPAHGDVADYVLGNFSKTDMEWVESLTKAVAENAPLLIEDNEAEFIKTTANADENTGAASYKPMRL